MMAVIAEYVEDQSQVEEMVRQTIKLLAHPNMRVRYAGWGCLAQFGEDHAETVPETFANEVCQAFIIGLDDPVQKVLKRSLEGFGIVLQFIERDLLEPACKPILQKLAPRAFAALEQFPKLTEEALAVISILAQQMEDGFAPYYAELMPLLMQTMKTTAASVEKRSCFGRTVECIAHVGSAGGAATFKNDAQNVMQAMIEVSKSAAAPAEDVGKEYILVASEVICKTLKKEFAPFVPYILPMVVELLNVKPTDIHAGGIDLENDDEQTQLTITVVTTAEGETKVLGLKTAEIEDMSTALTFVKCMVDELEEMYAPFIKDTATAMLNVFDFELGEEVREEAFGVWASLITVARKTSNTAVLRELLQSLMGRVLQAMETTDDLAWELTQATGLSECLKAAGPAILQDNEVSTICTQVFKLMRESLERREQIDKEGAQNAGDDDDEVNHEADSDDFNVVTVDIRIRAALCEILGAVMQHHADHFMKLVAVQMLQMVEGFLMQKNEKHKGEEKKLAVYVICDIIEHLKERAGELWPKLVPTLIECVGDKDNKISQASAYGLALAAPQAQFAPFAAQATARLQALLPTMEKKGKKDKVRSLAVRDNAVSAFGLILRHHRASVPAAADANIWAQWLGYLPLKTDEEEAQKVHEMLAVLVQEQHAELLGKDYAHLSKILGIFADVYGNEELVTKETTEKIHAIIKTLGEAGLSRFGHALTAKQQKKLERMWRNSQKGGFTPAPRA
jgi:hypothetical protein